MRNATATKWAEVDGEAITDNARELKRFIGPRCRLMAMVKANGYGHGMVVAARAALGGGADWLGVSSIVEALELRDSGFSVPILNVGWTPLPDMELAAGADIDVTVFALGSVEAAVRAGRRLRRPVHVHWKVDTGMGRLGTPLRRVAEISRALHEADQVRVSGLFTQFASADGPSLDDAQRQHQRFVRWLVQAGRRFPDALVHCANSAAMLRMPETQHDMTRPGLSLYGYAPPHCEGIIALRPALTLKTVVTQVKRVAAGDSVGYGATWVAPTASMVATLAAGYADGFDRRNSNRGRVLVKGVVCPVVGRVSMDQATVDVSAVDGIVPGTEVTLLGPSPAGEVDAAAVAERIGTIPNEVLCAVASRVPRVPVRSRA